MATSMINRMNEAGLEDFEPKAPIPGLSATPLLPLREALKDIAIEEKELYLSTAEIYYGDSLYHSDGSPPVSGEEGRAIYIYTCEMVSPQKSLYHELNSRLRDRERSKVKPFLPYMKLLLSGLSKLKRPVKQNLWRAVSNDLYDSYINKIGKVIVFWGFSSTTVDMQALKQFLPAGGTLFCIRTENAYSVSAFSAYPAEAEMLIPAGTVFKIMNVYRADKTTMIELVEEKNLLDFKPADQTPPSAMAASMPLSAANEKQTIHPSDNSTSSCEALPSAMAALSMSGGAKPLSAANEKQTIHPSDKSKSSSEADELSAGKANSPAPVKAVAETTATAAGSASDAKALYEKGIQYENGIGVPFNLVEARRQYEAAAALGHAGAEYTLGVYYQFGHGGLQQDLVEAVKLYRRSAEKEHAIAQYCLGTFYWNGLGGLPKDDNEASKLFQLAADKGYEPAKQVLANLAQSAGATAMLAPKTAEALFQEAVQFQTGQGVPVNLVEARIRLEAAAGMGHPGAECELGNFYFHGQGGLQKNDAAAIRYFHSSAEKGFMLGQFNLGVAFWNGCGGLVKDAQRALALFQLAAAQGYQPAIEAIAIASRPVSEIPAPMVIPTQTLQANVEAVFQEGYNYLNGIGVPVNIVEGTKRLAMAASHGHARAEYIIAGLYAEGKGGLRQDLTEAVRFWSRSAQKGFAPAQYELAISYEQGEGGLQRDIESAKVLYQLAAERGHIIAAQALQRLAAAFQSPNPMGGGSMGYSMGVGPAPGVGGVTSLPPGYTIAPGPVSLPPAYGAPYPAMGQGQPESYGSGTGPANFMVRSLPSGGQAGYTFNPAVAAGQAMGQAMVASGPPSYGAQYAAGMGMGYPSPMQSPPPVQQPVYGYPSQGPVPAGYAQGTGAGMGGGPAGYSVFPAGVEYPSQPYGGGGAPYPNNMAGPGYSGLTL